MFKYNNVIFMMPCHYATGAICAQKEETAHRSLSKAKLLFFSVLLAFGQRNNHFSGCKGTHNKWNMQHLLRLLPKYLSFFMIP